jgi:hypothetical protein
MFLTTSPGNNNTNAAEVEIFLHSPTYSQQWVASLTQLGQVNVSGVTWNVAESPTNAQGTADYVFMPASGANFSSGTINILTMLQYLVSHGGLSSSVYFNGLATGVETDSGSGSWSLTTNIVDPLTASSATPATSSASSTMVGSATTTSPQQAIAAADPPPAGSPSTSGVATQLLQHMASGFEGAAGSTPPLTDSAAHTAQHGESFLALPQHLLPR